MPASIWMGGKGPAYPEEAAALRGILKSVSRSFYLSLAVLPKPLRKQMGLAYLFCRAADTIADTPLLPYHERLPALHAFRAQFESDSPSRNEIAGLIRSVSEPSAGGCENEHQLLVRLPACFDLFDRLSLGDRRLVGSLVSTLSQGMEMDLVSFPADVPERVQALPDQAALERYAYYVAGVVGEFWTMLCEANLPVVRNSATLPQRKDHARRFGQGLQLTNILKDVGKDLQSGRCYLPADAIRELGLHPRDLLDPGDVGTDSAPDRQPDTRGPAAPGPQRSLRTAAAQASLAAAPELHVAVVVRGSDLGSGRPLQDPAVRSGTS